MGVATRNASNRAWRRHARTNHREGVTADRVAIVRYGVRSTPRLRRRRTGPRSDPRDSFRVSFRFLTRGISDLRRVGNSACGRTRTRPRWRRTRLRRRRCTTRPLGSASARSANVRFLPFFPASKIPSVLASADAHVVTIKHGLEGVVVPSKMYGILAAGRPRRARAEANRRRIVGRSRGLWRGGRSRQAREVVAIMRSLAGDPDRLGAMGRPRGPRHLDMRERVNSEISVHPRRERVNPDAPGNVVEETAVLVSGGASFQRRLNGLRKKPFSSGGRCFSTDVNCVLSTGFSLS